MLLMYMHKGVIPLRRLLPSSDDPEENSRVLRRQILFACPYTTLPVLAVITIRHQYSMFTVAVIYAYANTT
jgi:hypothetical protein